MRIGREGFGAGPPGEFRQRTAESTPGRPRAGEGAGPPRDRDLTRVVADRLRLARWGEDRRGQTSSRQPLQPPSGPGGAEYRHGAVRQARLGQDAAAYWLFEPAEPRPKTAPLIVLLHGWGGGDPAAFGAWIDHLVLRGNAVVFPVYQDSLRTPAATMLRNSMAAVVAAASRDAGPEGVRLDLGRTAVVGHSLGGLLGLHLAARAARDGLPRPRALMAMAPGGDGSGLSLAGMDTASLPAELLLLVVAGEDDHVAGDRLARLMFTSLPHLPVQNKNLLVLRSDYHGSPPLVANHRAPTAARAPRAGGASPDPRGLLDPRLQRGFPPADAMDYYGYWKLFDALTDAAFYGTHRMHALGDTVQQRSMGVWSDGTPVREPRVIVDPRMLTL